MRVKIKTMVVDDHALVRDGIRQLLARQDDIEVLGEAVDGRDLLKLAKKLRPDVVLLDVAMPRLNGLNVMPLLKDTLPGVKVVMLSMHDKETYIHQALAAGAMGYVLKTDSSREVLEAVRKAAAGQYFLSPALNAGVIRGYLNPDVREKGEATGYDTLTSREQQVFRLVVEGHTTKEIAATLFLSPRTVEKHRANIVRKLGIRDSKAMIRYAIRIGVVDPELWNN